MRLLILLFVFALFTKAFGNTDDVGSPKPGVNCILNILQVLLAIPLTALDPILLIVVIMRVGSDILTTAARKHLAVKNVLEQLGLGVNNIFSSAVGGLFNLVGLGGVVQVPIKLVSSVVDLGKDLVENTVGKIPIVGDHISDIFDVISSIFRG